MKRHQIEPLLKNYDFGTRILFEYNLEQWKESIEMPLCSVRDEVSSSALSLNPS